MRALALPFLLAVGAASVLAQDTPRPSRPVPAVTRRAGDVLDQLPLKFVGPPTTAAIMKPATMPFFERFG